MRCAACAAGLTLNAPPDHDLSEEIAQLKHEVARLNRHRFVRLYDSVPKLMAYWFGSGLLFGLGTVLGGSLLLSYLILTLSSIDFLPIIGDWAARIAEEMDTSR